MSAPAASSVRRYSKSLRSARPDVAWIASARIGVRSSRPISSNSSSRARPRVACRLPTISGVFPSRFHVAVVTRGISSMSRYLTPTRFAAPSRARRVSMPSRCRYCLRSAPFRNARIAASLASERSRSIVVVLRPPESSNDQRVSPRSRRPAKDAPPRVRFGPVASASRPSRRPHRSGSPTETVPPRTGPSTRLKLSHGASDTRCFPTCCHRYGCSSAQTRALSSPVVSTGAATGPNRTSVESESDRT